MIKWHVRYIYTLHGNIFKVSLKDNFALILGT